jgi:hypothetical protein
LKPKWSLSKVSVKSGEDHYNHSLLEPLLTSHQKLHLTIFLEVTEAK